MAVRNAPWSTIPAVFSNWQIDRGPGRFQVTFDAHHTYAAIDFTWWGGARSPRTA